MGVFSRFMDIVNANINALLDKAEDPEKMIRLMLQEVEDTLIELKSSCAANMASKTKVERNIKEQQELANRWLKRAELALENGNEELAKEALLERKRALDQVERLKNETNHFDKLVEKCKEEIEKLEEKLISLRQKHQTIKKRMAEQKFNSQKFEEDATTRFDQMEMQVDRMTSRNDFDRLERDLEARFASLEEEKEIEDELERLKQKKAKN